MIDDQARGLMTPVAPDRAASFTDEGWHVSPSHLLDNNLAALWLSK